MTKEKTYVDDIITNIRSIVYYDNLNAKTVLDNDLKYLTVPELKDCKSKISDLLVEYNTKDFCDLLKSIIIEVDLELNKRECTYYSIPELTITTTHHDTVNNYKLYNCNINVFPTFIQYKKYKMIALRTRIYTKDIFMDKLDDICCSDWNKKDANNIMIKSSESRRRDNFNKMWELPYPKDLLLETVKIGCYNRMESVRYSNFMCYVLEQKELVLDVYKQELINILTGLYLGDAYLAVYTFGYLGDHEI